MMDSENAAKVRKYQVRISPENSIKIEKVPSSVQRQIMYYSATEIQAIEKTGIFEMCFILKDSSTEEELIPLRDQTRRFAILLVAKN